MSKNPAIPSMYVRDLMTVGVATCSPDTPISQIAGLLLEKQHEAVIVLDNVDGNSLGVVGQEELVRAYALSGYEHLKAEDIMREGVEQIPPDIPVQVAAQIMQDRGVRCLFLMHHAGGIEYPAAVITYKHFLRHMNAMKEEDLEDLGIHAKRQSPMEAFIHKREVARLRNRE